MEEVEIRFEREGQEGLVASGTYLIDAAKRLGIRFEESCMPETGLHFCAVTIQSGSELLSPETAIEKDFFAANTRGANERLACQVKIERKGEVVVMTKEKPKAEEKEAPAPDTNEEYRKQFAELPLEKKIANLVQLETIALGETVSFIINSPFKIADMAMNVMAEFGFRKEERERDAARPQEHKAEPGDPASNGEQSKAS